MSEKLDQQEAEHEAEKVVAEYTSCELPICPFAIAKKKEHRRPTQGVFGARRFGIPYATRGDLRNPVCEPYRQ